MFQRLLRREFLIPAVGIVALLPMAAGTECPMNGNGGTPGTGFPKTTVWTQRTIDDMTGIRPNAMVFADFDRDNQTDFAVAYSGFDATPARYVIFFGSDTGTFTPVPLLNTNAVIPIAAAIVAGDLNGDGRPDLVAATNEGILYMPAPADTRTGSAWQGFILNNSSDTESLPWRDVKIGAIDGANGPDLVAAGGTIGRVAWFRSPAANISTGNDWTRFDIDATSRADSRGVVLADLNGDSRLDIVSTAAGEMTARIAWYANPANPAVDSWPRFTIGNLAAAGRVAMGDLNVDGRDDVVVVNGPGRQVGWYMRPVDATQAWSGFQLTQYTAATPIDLAIADVDGNNQPDVILATRQPGSVRWFTPVSVQTNVWTENNVRDLNENVAAIATRDFDADARPDVAALLLGADVTGDNISWLENPEP